MARPKRGAAGAPGKQAADPGVVLPGALDPTAVPPLTLPRFARVPPSPRLRGEGGGEGQAPAEQPDRHSALADNANHHLLSVPSQEPRRWTTAFESKLRSRRRRPRSFRS